MLAEFIVLFRESLEIVLIVGIMLACLRKTGNHGQEKHVWLGTAAGIIISIAFAVALKFFFGGFGESEALFEGLFMVLACALVSWFLLWVLAQGNIAEGIRSEIKAKTCSANPQALFFTVLIAVLREGIETVLFVFGIYFSTGSLSLVSSVLGIAAAITAGVVFFFFSAKLDISTFFKLTTVLLVLLAAGLLSQGVHELQEAGVLPTYMAHIYDINPPQNPDGTYPLLHEKGYFGSILKGLVGYDGNPSIEQVIAYLGYLAGFFVLYKGHKQ
ncbi:high-affinity iron transporter [Candidatus Micrarchaeota archaeon CG11_big_fil_rev_8_21_14_0_20_47_5]|nr:MAG: hypothetical protein AUJ17_02215 [Candidatus Micrarchaeota archaeon CG1_02_47_40]PIN83886.1 MAG: high-affinity iron transporter [Candidatus Micrarchaeota archaeon CG11_big_fil_rev_8_21_14_0_20_47_5]